MNTPSAPQKGEMLKLGPPASGEVVVIVDPALTGATCSAGTETLLPGAEMPVHRLLDQDRVLFIHKGQGRATLNEQTMIVLPGAMLHVPRGAWHGLRNTGTGALRIAWASAPPGLDVWLRELSRLGAAPSAQALQELAQRHRVEFRQATEGPKPAGSHHRGRRGGRRHHVSGSARAASSAPQVAPSAAAVGPAVAPAVAPSVGAAPSPTAVGVGAARGHPRHRSGRHRRGGGRSRSASPAVATAPQGRPVPAGGSAPVSAPATKPASSRPGGAERPRSPRGYRSRRLKEVYMGGRWVQVEGGAPVIAPGRERQGRRGPKRDGDDDPPHIRLSVPL